MKRILLYFILIASTFYPQIINAQIFASGNSAQGTTSYPTHTENHPVYLFKKLSEGGLTATTTSVGTSFSYSWFKYDKVAKNWSSVMSGNANNLSTIEETGYRVDITIDGSKTESYYCWAFVPEIISCTIDTTNHTCSTLSLTAKPVTKALTYYDITSGANVSFNYDFVHSWSSAPEGDISTKTDATPTIDAPFENTAYFLTLKAFGETSSIDANIDVEAKAVDASFVMSPTDREYENEIQELDIESFKGSAPVQIRFTSEESKGTITEYEYEFIKQGDSETEEYEYAPHLEPNTNFTFNDAGKYTISLTVTNNFSGCSDTETKGPIDVIEMKIEAPNVFTPDGDGINDKFMVIYKSVSEFKMTILNRWGRKVFSTTNPGDFWDGTIAGKKASEGVYFYYIYAKGFNKGEEDELEGPLHLIRGE